ncbi:MAG TPA: sugar transferase [Planctomycetota bacterium]|nr:sugar transferase [Planctomycetota bacterium]
MFRLGNFLRRNFEPLILSMQVFVDLAVLLVCCWLGYLMGLRIGGTGRSPDMHVYRQLWALISAVCLVSFHAFGMYSPVKSLLNMEEFKAIAKSSIVSFLVFFTLVVLLRSTTQGAEGFLFEWMVPAHQWVDLDFNLDVASFSRITVVITFCLILVLTTASRFASFKVIQMLHQRGVGNRNVLIYGAGDTGRTLQRKFMLVPTLGLNLIGFVDDDPERAGAAIGRFRVLGSRADMEYLVGLHKVSEVFIALPDRDEEEVMAIVAACERSGVKYHVVPRFYHLLSYKIRIENLDSIPLISRAERSQSLLSALTKRLLDVLLSILVLVLGAPFFVLAALLIRRESPGRALFVQERIGKDGKPFRMYKFRTMHQQVGGDAPAPNSPYDPRITRIGRFLRRYSLDELPQFLNVLMGQMSIVGPRPEMRFIVDQYGPLELERLRAKPGVTGLWQISYAREQAIHDNMDYDLYYIEHQSLLLDLVIIALTGFAVAKGTGAY